MKVDINQPTLAPIDVEFVVAEGLQAKTDAKRRPYVKLIRKWAQKQGCAEEGEAVVSRLALEGGATGQNDLSKQLYMLHQKYREADKVELLMKLVREIDEIIKMNSNWTWAHVMRVMMDESILITNIPNRFDLLICAMIPGRGAGTVRKSGDYELTKSKRTWREWIENYADDLEEANNRAVCKEIFNLLQPLLS